MNKQIQYRASKSAEWSARNDEEGKKVIEGYFSVFNSETELWPGAYEEIASTAFDSCFNADVRCLINHDTNLVLGRTKAGTLTLRKDEKGLFGSVLVNENDSDAVNLYERVKRGDVDQCSFGFCIKKQAEEIRSDGSVKWIIEDIELFEVSIVTFPAYADTGVEARKKEFDQKKERSLEVKKNNLKERLKHVKTTNVA